MHKFIPGLHKEYDTGAFTWPTTIDCYDLTDLLDSEGPGPTSFFQSLKMPSSRNPTNWDNVLCARWHLQRRGKNPDTDPYVLDHAAGFEPTAMYNCSPCLIKGRRVAYRTYNIKWR